MEWARGGCIQETHLTNDHYNYLSKPWVQWLGCSCHASYTRSVSSLVHWYVPWECLQVKTDPERRYIFIHAQLYVLPFVIFGIYNPSPTTLKILREAELFVSKFNLLLHPLVNRHGDPFQQIATGPTPFCHLPMKLGLEKYSSSHTRAYAWSKQSLGTLSSFDLALGNDKLLTKLLAATYLSWGVSNHSPLLVMLTPGQTGLRPTWKNSPGSLLPRLKLPIITLARSI